MIKSCENIILAFRYKNIEDHLDQIIPPILYEQPHNYEWSIRVCLIEQ